MAYCVRRMHKEDVSQVTEIDREAFPTLWPPVNYQHELQNRLAHHIVVCDGERTVQETDTRVAPQRALPVMITKVRQLFSLNRFLGNELPPSGTEYIVGFVGLWLMADEAHITNIAVRESYRRRGIGELLLISAIGLAAELNARIITLEVRASNIAAQGLYCKYGFTQVGLRRKYYIDNKEDAILMSTEDISSASFQSYLQRLKQVHSRKLGIALYQVRR